MFLLSLYPKQRGGGAILPPERIRGTLALWNQAISEIKPGKFEVRCIVRGKEEICYAQRGGFSIISLPPPISLLLGKKSSTFADLDSLDSTLAVSLDLCQPTPWLWISQGNRI